MTLKNLLAVILVLHSFQYSALADEEKKAKGVSRRSFLQRASSAVAAAVAIPSLPFSATTTAAKGIPQALSRKLARVRLSTLGTSDSGLKLYISQLKELKSPTTPASLKKYLNVRIKSAEKALKSFDAMKAERASFKMHTKSLGAKAAEENALKSASEISNHGLKKVNQKKIESLGDLSSMPPDVRMLALRTLLDVNLMSRMAWQAYYGDQTVTLTKTEVQLLDEYKRLLNLTLEAAPKKGLASVLIPKLLQEADFVLEAYRSTSQTKKIKGLSCKSIL